MPYDSVECYDPSTDRWTYIYMHRGNVIQGSTFYNPLDRRGRGLSVAALGGKFYAVGGSDGYEDIAEKQVDCFDPSTGEWSHQPPARTSVAFNARAGVTVL